MYTDTWRLHPMLTTIEAMIEPDGRVRLLEPVQLPTACRALVIILDDAASATERALLSERALAADWGRAEEDAAWVHLQRAR